jgi:hypothetical protein
LVVQPHYLYKTDEIKITALGVPKTTSPDSKIASGMDQDIRMMLYNAKEILASNFKEPSFRRCNFQVRFYDLLKAKKLFLA